MEPLRVSANDGVQLQDEPVRPRIWAIGMEIIRSFIKCRPRMFVDQKRR
jgi:hypothetical protein